MEIEYFDEEDEIIENVNIDVTEEKEFFEEEVFSDEVEELEEIVE